MREAFRQALDELETEPQRSQPDRHVLQLLRGAAAAPGTPHAISPDELSRLIFRARKLGRSWASYTHQGAAFAHDLIALRDVWTALAFQLPTLLADQRVAVLAAFVDGLGLTDERLTERKRGYLVRQQETRRAQFLGFSPDRGALHWLSASGYVVHALEELADAALDERRQLNALLVDQLGSDHFTFGRLLEFLSCWLVGRGEAAWQERCASSERDAAARDSGETAH
jgi:hypothetical protein